MAGLILMLLAATLAALLLTGSAVVLAPRHGRALTGLGAGLSGLACLLGLTALALPDASASLAVPVGLPAAPLQLQLDPLSAAFLLPVAFAGCVILAFAALNALPQSAAEAAGLVLAIAGLLLALLTADGLTLALALALAGAAFRLTDPSGSGSGILLASLFAAACVVVASALLPPAAATDPLRASAAALLATAGLGTLAGLVPAHHWFVAAHRRMSPLAGALLSAGLPCVAAYGLIRLPLAAVPEAGAIACWLPLLLAGAASVLAGGLGASRDLDLPAALAFGSVRQAGLMAIGIGLAAVGRSTDLPNLTALALAAVLLLACVQTVCGSVAALAGAAIHQRAGARQLDRLGGVLRGMPVTSACLLAGLGGQASMPPAPGFAVLFLLFQGLLAAPRAGPGRPLLLIALVMVVGLGGVFACISLVRLFGLACLGRPRVPRAAGADELPSLARRPLLIPALLSCLLCLFPGPVLRLLAAPAVRVLSGEPPAGQFGWLVLAPTTDARGYAPLPLALLLGSIALAIAWLLRRRSPTGSRRVAFWQDGFAAPPPWLPFGDPLTQWNGAVPLPPALPRLRLPIRLRQARRMATAPAAALLALAALLAALVLSGLA